MKYGLYSKNTPEECIKSIDINSTSPLKNHDLDLATLCFINNKRLTKEKFDRLFIVKEVIDDK